MTLHGKGFDEHSLDALAADLRQQRLEVVALRGPLPARAGFGWYRESGIGLPHADSLASMVEWFFAQLDERAGDRPVALFGFSAGMVAATAALLAQRARFLTAALCAGCLPGGGVVPLVDGVLADLPVFYGFDPQDPIIPGPMLDQTSAWLAGPSGARLTERRYEGIGHDLTDEMRSDAVSFLAATVA